MLVEGIGAATLSNGHTCGLHVAVFPYPARGHNLPIIQLARRLVLFDIKVTLVNIYDHMSDDLLEILRASDIVVVNLGIRLSDPGPGGLPYFLNVESLEGEAEKLVESLAAENGRLPLKCIISDIFLGWTQRVADKYNIPRYAFCASPAKFLSAFLYLPTLAVQGKIPVSPSRVSELVDIPGCAPTLLGDLSPCVQAWTKGIFFQQYVYRNAQPALEAAGFLINSLYELESSCIDVLQSNLRTILPVGALLHDSYLQLLNQETASGEKIADHEAPYIRWLNSQLTASVLYVNFGSVASMSIQQIHELALGLDASMQPFLLVVRPQMCKDSQEILPVLPEGFKAHKEGKGFVQHGWISQLDVLSHPAVGGFLTHCGWNSTLESICRGLPLLAWPIQADQRFVCRLLVHEKKAAIEVHKQPDGMVLKEEVVRAVRKLMVEPEGQVIKMNLLKMRNIVKKEMAKDGSNQKNFERFVMELRNWSSLGDTRLEDNGNAGFISG